EVHLDRIHRTLLANTERGRWRRWRKKRIYPAGKDILEIALDQSAYLLRSQIVGVVIAGGEHVGADHDAPAHLPAETLGSRALVHVSDVARRLAQPIPHAVVARQIGRRFGRRDDVVGRQRVLGVRQRYLDDLGAGGLEPLRPLLPEFVDLGCHALDPVFPGNADLDALEWLCDTQL